MKPIIKYQGGKTRELPIIKKLAPAKFERIIEPFAGGAAVSFAYEKPAILCDINDAVLNLYMMVRQPGMYHEIFSHVNWLKTCLLYTSPSPRDATLSRMPSSA